MHETEDLVIGVWGLSSRGCGELAVSDLFGDELSGCLLVLFAIYSAAAPSCIKVGWTTITVHPCSMGKGSCYLVLIFVMLIRYFLFLFLVTITILWSLVSVFVLNSGFFSSFSLVIKLNCVC